MREADGSYHFVARHSGKCLSTDGSTTNSVPLVRRPCGTSAAQSFRLTTG
ncbi:MULTISPECIES: RICIN domain-containing protein [Streptomyces]